MGRLCMGVDGAATGARAALRRAQRDAILATVGQRQPELVGNVGDRAIKGRLLAVSDWAGRSRPCHRYAGWKPAVRCGGRSPDFASLVNNRIPSGTITGYRGLDPLEQRPPLGAGVS